MQIQAFMTARGEHCIQQGVEINQLHTRVHILRIAQKKNIYLNVLRVQSLLAFSDFHVFLWTVHCTVSCFTPPFVL